MAENNFSVELFTEKHMQEVFSWYAAHGQNPPDLHFLSDFGIVVTLHGDPVFCCWYYTTNSSLAYIDFAIINPAISRPVRSRVMDFFLSLVDKLAKNNDDKYVIVLCKLPTIMRRLERHDYMLSKDLSVYIKKV